MTIRNPWKKTPLERIIESIEAANNQIIIEKEKLKCLIEPRKRGIQESKINDLIKTVEILEEEKKKRKEKVERLNKNREILIMRISEIKYNQNLVQGEMNLEIKRILKRINSIDDDLGPFRHYDKPFYLD